MVAPYWATQGPVQIVSRELHLQKQNYVKNLGIPVTQKTVFAFGAARRERPSRLQLGYFFVPRMAEGLRGDVGEERTVV